MDTDGLERNETRRATEGSKEPQMDADGLERNETRRATENHGAAEDAESKKPPIGTDGREKHQGTKCKAATVSGGGRGKGSAMWHKG